MPIPAIPTADLTARLQRLGALLVAHEELWRPSPFHVPRPRWCQAYPDYAAHLLGLEGDPVRALADDNQALIQLAAGFVPGLQELVGLIRLPRVQDGPVAQGPGLAAHVPGRKQAQIDAFAAGVGAPVLEWCAGKGHLGRLISHRWQWPVLSLELDEALCRGGEELAGRARVRQDFLAADALRSATQEHLHGRHALALHACGDLHLALLRGAVAQKSPALDLAPCCYYRIATRAYVPLNPEADLRLSRDELHLAVSETVTAGARERRQRDRAMAWKLAFLEWRSTLGIPWGRTFKPVPGAWYTQGFADWLQRLAQREGLAPPPSDAALTWESQGWARQREVVRLDLARLAFRRALEIWLALDQTLFLARHGYRVGLAEFCDRHTTPRNQLISARL